MNWQTTVSHYAFLASGLFLAFVVAVDRAKHLKDPKEPLERHSYRLLGIVVAFDLAAAGLAFWGEYLHHAPRHVTTSQRDVLCDYLGVFGHQKFRVVQVGWGDPEAANYAVEISNALKYAGWDGTTIVSIPPEKNLQQSPGVGVMYSADDAKTLRDPTNTILPALRSIDRAMEKAGIIVYGPPISPDQVMVGGTLWPTNGDYAIPAGTIQISIGKNPDAE